MGETKHEREVFERAVQRVVEQGRKFGSEPIGGEAGARKYVRENVAKPTEDRRDDKKRRGR